MIKAVLFDLDGVLVNSEVVKHLVIKDFIEEKGYDIDHRLFFKLIGSHSTLNTWDEIFDQIDDQIIDQKTFKKNLLNTVNQSLLILILARIGCLILKKR